MGPKITAHFNCLKVDQKGLHFLLDGAEVISYPFPNRIDFAQGDSMNLNFHEKCALTTTVGD